MTGSYGSVDPFRESMIRFAHVEQSVISSH
jgi:hypothetical protein